MELPLLLIVIIEANDEGVGDGAGDGDVGSGRGRQVHGSSMFLGEGYSIYLKMIYTKLLKSHRYQS